MNQVFSLNRWLLLMRRHWMENTRLFLYGTLSLTGAIAITLFFWLGGNAHYSEYSLLVFYIIGLYIAGAIFASGAFDVLQKKSRGIYFLSLPASHFEKLLTQIFYNLIFFTLVYTLCYFVMEQLVVLIVYHRVAADPVKYSFDLINWDDPYGEARSLNYIIMLFFGVQALFLLGSVYFKRFSFLLTATVLVIYFFFIAYYLNLLRQVLIPTYYWDSDALHPLHMMEKTYRLSGALSFGLKWLMLLGWAPVFWLAAWWRLKEKEI